MGAYPQSSPESESASRNDDADEQAPEGSLSDALMASLRAATAGAEQAQAEAEQAQAGAELAREEAEQAREEAEQRLTELGHAVRKSSAPAGKVKASFNLLPEDIDSLRAMAQRLGTTVTYVLQRAIRDERFVRDMIAEGNRFDIVDRKGNRREIIWR
jgi:hypothetical protein